MGSVPSKLRQRVARRAKFRCEYCQLQQDLCPETFELDHIVPKSVGGVTDFENLCLACPVCNNAKRDQIVARDSTSGRTVPLFNPRTQVWSRHFRWSADFSWIVGRTAVGRATVDALEMNHARVVQIRLLWATMGLHPPG
jgi:hypothetical protein